MDRDINQRNYDEVVQTMRKLVEKFYGDYSKEYTSFYSLLNKLNTEMKSNTSLQSQIKDIKSEQTHNWSST